MFSFSLISKFISKVMSETAWTKYYDSLISTNTLLINIKNMSKWHKEHNIKQADCVR